MKPSLRACLSSTLDLADANPTGSGKVRRGVVSEAGWLFEENKASLAFLLGVETRWILEVGSFHGLSARFMLRAAPNARIVCVDTWDGFVAPNADANFATFKASCTAEASRIVPILGRSQEVLPRLHDLGFLPDLIYVDGAHDLESVLADLRAAIQFPGALVCGDDYAPEFPGVVTAVQRVALGSDRRIENRGRFFSLGVNPLPRGWRLLPHLLRRWRHP